MPPVVASTTNPTLPTTTHTQPAPPGVTVTQGDSDPRDQLPILDDPAAAGEKPLEPRAFKRHVALVQSVALAPNGRRFLSVSTDKTLLDWTVDDDKAYRRHMFKSGVSAVAYSPNGQRAAVCDEGTVCLFDLGKNTILASRTYPRGNTQCLAFDPDGIHVLVGGTDGALHWWNLNDEKAEKTIDITTNESVTTLAMSSDGANVAAGLSDGSVGVWELATRRKLWHGIAHKDKTVAGTTAVAFAPGGKHIASAGLDKTAALWAVAGGPSVKRFVHESPVLAVAFVARGTQLVTGVKDSTIRVWDLETGHPLRTLKTQAPVHCMALHREDKFLIAGGLNGNLQLIVLKDALSDPSLRDTPPENKYAAPDAAELDAATLAIRNAYRTQFDSEKVEDREALLDRLLLRAVGKEPRPTRFALFREAHDLAARLGKIPSAFKVVDEMDKWFQIEVFGEKTAALALAARDAPPAAQKGVMDAVNAQFALAEKEGRAEAVTKLLEAMTQSAAKSGNPAIVKQIDDFQKKRAADLELRDRIAQLKAKLKDMPNDSEANLAYGLILCADQKWKDGLPMLAKAADKALAALAAKDLAGVKEFKDKRDLANEWWLLSRAADEGKTVFLMRAKHWYDQIKSELTGQDKLDLATRINQIDEMLAKAKKPETGPAVVAPKPKRDEPIIRKNFDTLRNEATFKSEWKYDGEFRIESGGIRLAPGKGSITSTFQLIDNWKIAIAVVPESTDIQIEVNQETFTLKAYSSASVVMVERKGKKLGYTFEQRGRPIGQPVVIQLKDDRLGPSAITINTESNFRSTSKSDGTLLQRILVNGPVKVSGPQ